VLAGLMQDDFQLALPYALRRLRTYPGTGEVVTLTREGRERAPYPEVSARIDRLAHALRALGVNAGDRIATFAWNTQRHFECYFAIPCTGAVLHTLNIRLHADQLAYVVNHAADRVIFVDDTLAPRLAQIADRLPSVERYVVMGDAPTDLPNAVGYEELLAQAPDAPYPYPDIPERQAAALCYTTGTTGEPKGVLYSHRSIVLHSTSLLMTDAIGLQSSDRALLVVPMFHVNGWGWPHAAALNAMTLLLPGPHTQPEPLASLIASERASVIGCVPTLYADLLRYADEHHPDLSSLRFGVCGGSAMPPALAQALHDRHGLALLHAWGMTETSPMGTVSKAHPDPRSPKQGRAVPFVELRITGEDGAELPWDGRTPGELEARGPWVAAGYYNDPTAGHDGWLRTGDVAQIDADGYVELTDRTKDVIRSGGEWISSVTLENLLMSHPAVREAAVIAIADERFGERPLAAVVLDAPATAEELREHLRPHVASFWLPERFAFLEELPKTSVGKFDKRTLRARRDAGDLGGCGPGS
jgi:fatty-acyl-CoA synthase